MTGCRKECRLSRMNRGLVAILCALSASFVQAKNVRNVPLGGRTALMGNAGIAEGHDSAMIYLNPAGTAGTPHDVFSLSSNLYAYDWSQIPDLLHANGFSAERYGDVTVTSERNRVSQLRLVPSTLTYYKRLKGSDREMVHVFGMGLLTTSSSNVAREGTLSAASPAYQLRAEQTERFAFSQLHLGFSYAMQPWSGFRVGVALLGTYASLSWSGQSISVEALENEAGQVFPERVYQSNLWLDGYSLGVGAVAGLQVKVWQNLWLGASLASPNLSLMGGGTTKDIEVHPENGGEGMPGGTDLSAHHATIHAGIGQGELTHVEVNNPLRASTGLAYAVPGRFSVAVDVHYHAARRQFITYEDDLSLTVFHTGERRQRIQSKDTKKTDARSHVAFAVGAEYFVSPTLAVRTGFYTDPDIDVQRDDYIDWWTVSLGIGVISDGLESNYGIGYRHGRGRISNTGVFEPAIDNAHLDYVAHGVMFMVSGALRTDRPATRSKK
ncbi:MAG: hypothetical protein VX589_00490 [Myxococcota bacterium]|nr:hypothetical protein [Myxococcota bacterium]